MRDLGDNAAHRFIVVTFYDLIHFRDTKSFYDILLVLWISDRAPVILDLDLSACCCFSFLSHYIITDPLSGTSRLGQFFDLLAAKPGDLNRVFHSGKSVKCSPDNIMSIV